MKRLSGMVRLEGNIHIPSYPDDSRPARPGPGSASPAVFLDRDGVIVEEVGNVTHPGQLCVLPHVPEAVARLQERYLVIVATNQAAVGMGLITEAGLLEVHREMAGRLYSRGAFLDGICYCPHRPGAALAAYDVQCGCRKPQPGMLVTAAARWGVDMSRSFMVGDRQGDMDAARAAGVRGIRVGASPAKQHRGVLSAPDLAGAADIILSTTGGMPEKGAG
ncbi:MAG: HAD family hydrolase [Dehalococcoidia bacterium]|nr:HAD family hydrolase [Dehalococcoidia bacterium]